MQLNSIRTFHCPPVHYCARLSSPIINHALPALLMYQPTLLHCRTANLHKHYEQLRCESASLSRPHIILFNGDTEIDREEERESQIERERKIFHYVRFWITNQNRNWLSYGFLNIFFHYIVFSLFHLLVLQNVNFCLSSEISLIAFSYAWTPDLSHHYNR